MKRTCACQIHLAGEIRCMHKEHEKYRLPVLQSDCSDCPLKVALGKGGQPILPTKMERLRNLASSAKKLAADGFRTVSRRCYDMRLDVCAGCTLNNKRDVCSACGCGIKAKAMGRAWKCELGFWDHIPADIQPGDLTQLPERTPEELNDDTRTN